MQFKNYYFTLAFFMLVMVFTAASAETLPKDKDCEKTCQAANRGCTNNCVQSGGSEEVCGSLCADRYSGCIYKCLYKKCGKK